MIKASEIRIGNWFIGYDDRPFKFGLYEFGLLENNHCELDEIIREGVKLTTSILENAGFDKKVDEGGPFYENSNGHRIYVFKDGFEFEYTLPSGRFNLWRKRNGLHQLQNLYHALTGEELEIKNPV